MITARRLCGVSVSTVVHVAAIVTALVIARAELESAIVIDLAADAAGETARDTRRSIVVPPSAVPPTHRSHVAAHTRRSARPAAAAPAAPSAELTPPDAEAPAPTALSAASPSSAEAPRDVPTVVTMSEPSSAAAAAFVAPNEPGERSGASAGSRGSGAAASSTGGGTDHGPQGEGSNTALARPGAPSGGIPAEYEPYLKRFRQRVQQSVSYPLAARRQGLAGTVEVEVLVDPSGRITGAAVVGSSSHALLDEAALQAVKRVSPEPMPERLPRRPLRIRVPLAFELQ